MLLGTRRGEHAPAEPARIHDILDKQISGKCGCLSVRVSTDRDAVTRLRYNYGSVSVHHQCGVSDMVQLTDSEPAKP